MVSRIARLPKTWILASPASDGKVFTLTAMHLLIDHRNRRIDGVEEADELLVAVALHVAAKPSSTLGAANKVVVP